MANSFNVLFYGSIMIPLTDDKIKIIMLTQSWSIERTNKRTNIRTHVRTHARTNTRTLYAHTHEHTYSTHERTNTRTNERTHARTNVPISIHEKLFSMEAEN